MFVEKKIGKYIMRIRPNEGGIHSNLLKIAKNGKEREPELLYILRTEIENGYTCIDLGANIGYATLLMADLVGDGKVIAVEPDPNNIELLKMNIKLNHLSDKIQVHHLGISNSNTEMNFYVGKSSNLGSMIYSKNTYKKPIKVQVKALSSFCSGFTPNLIKMDIEGHEVEVLEGMYNLIKDKEFPCKIVMELHPNTYTATHSLEHWMVKFFDNGFNTKYVVSAGVTIPDLFVKWGYKPIKTFGSRALYDGFTIEHMLAACCHVNKQWMPSKKRYSLKVARFVMIERK